MKWGYLILGDASCYTRSANAYQKIRMACECLKAALLVPATKRGWIPADFRNSTNVIEMPTGLSIVQVCKAHAIGGVLLPVSNERTMWLADRLTRHLKVVMLCWDPPGVSRRDQGDILSRIRCWTLDRIMCRATCRVECLIMNLHPGFTDRLGVGIQDKITCFPNGTNVDFNRLCAQGVVHVPFRIAVNGTFSDSKGCWEVAELFLRVWKTEPRSSLVWVGQGEEEENIHQLFVKAGVPTSSFVLGEFPHDEAMRQLASASVALCTYRDVPSLRWNYILKAPEFLSLGLPVVSVNLPGVAQYVREGETGALFAPGDSEEAYAKLRALLCDEARLERMCALALESAEAYDWTEINRRIANAILERVP